MTSVMPRRSAGAKRPRLTEEQVKQMMAKAEAARPQAKRIIDKARAFIVLDHPFFATPMLKRPMIERLDIPTLSVSDSGKIFYNPLFVASLTPEQMVFGICHEVLHYLSGHGVRRGARDPKNWNVAGDMWINDVLQHSNVGKFIDGCINVPGSMNRTVEDIYASFPPPDDDGDGNEPCDDGEPGDQQSSGDGDGDPIGQDLDDDPADNDGMSPEEIEAQRKIDVAEAAQVAKIKGKLPGVLSKFAEDTIASKTPWYEVLERYMTERVKNDQSWARPNRRYTPDYYLPVVDGVGSMGEVVLQVDISGSVSRQEIRHYNGHMKRIVEQCRPSKVHVIYTDTRVQKHDTFDKPEDVEIKYHSGGGTDMRAGFEYIAKQGIEPEVVVTLTDGYTPFPDDTDVPAVWCISSDVDSPSGETVHFDME